MSDTFVLQDSLALSDLATYLGRAARVEDGSVRLIAGGGVLAVYTAVLYPIGLLDESPTVLGLRTFALNAEEEFDAVVPLASLMMRLERLAGEPRDVADAVTVSLPMRVNTVTWAAISPPRGGWTALPEISADVLDKTARAGIEEVAETIPTGTGEQIVHRVRAEVWGRDIPDAGAIPAGAAFAALSLGFLPDATPESNTAMSVYETGPWTRLTSPRGHVLVKRKAWTLAR
ncbi:MAG: hypothetical protein ACOH1J_08575 [Microbacteriaceae bacterium]